MYTMSYHVKKLQPSPLIAKSVYKKPCPYNQIFWGRARSVPDGTRRRTGGKVKGKLANGVGSQYSHATSERGVSSITQADAHTSAASSRLNWRPQRFKWTRPFWGKTKSGFCACAITFRTSFTCVGLITGLEDSYRVWCVSHHESSIMSRSWPTGGFCAMVKISQHHSFW